MIVCSGRSSLLSLNLGRYECNSFWQPLKIVLFWRSFCFWHVGGPFVSVDYFLGRCETLLGDWFKTQLVIHVRRSTMPTRRLPITSPIATALMGCRLALRIHCTRKAPEFFWHTVHKHFFVDAKRGLFWPPVTLCVTLQFGDIFSPFSGSEFCHWRIHCYITGGIGELNWLCVVCVASFWCILGDFLQYLVPYIFDI